MKKIMITQFLNNIKKLPLIYFLYTVWKTITWEKRKKKLKALGPPLAGPNLIYSPWVWLRSQTQEHWFMMQDPLNLGLDMAQDNRVPKPDLKELDPDAWPIIFES